MKLRLHFDVLDRYPSSTENPERAFKASAHTRGNELPRRHGHPCTGHPCTCGTHVFEYASLKEEMIIDSLGHLRQCCREVGHSSMSGQMQWLARVVGAAESVDIAQSVRFPQSAARLVDWWPWQYR